MELVFDGSVLIKRLFKKEGNLFGVSLEQTENKHAIGEERPCEKEERHKRDSEVWLLFEKLDSMKVLIEEMEKSYKEFEDSLKKG